MKKVAIFCLVLFASQLSFAQVDMFQEKEFVWLGIDFTGAKMVGSTHFRNAKIVKEELFDKWNQITIDEWSKFNLQEFYEKKMRHNDLIPVKNRNKLVNEDELLVDMSTHSLSKKEVAAICSTYKGKTQLQEGLGVLYVVEAFNHTNERAYVYVTFMDLATGQAVYIKKYEGIPGGAGVRNFWANAIFRVMEQSMEDYRRDYRLYARHKGI